MPFSSILKSKKIDKTIFLNIFSLYFVNFFRFALNLITLPHLLKIYGPEKWGQITFFQIIISYLIWISDWSLDQHSSKLLSINEGNVRKQIQIFKSSISAQFSILIFILLSLDLYSYFFAINKLIFIYINLIIIGNFLQPHWYLIGREKIYESAIFLLINKLFFSFFILFFINKSSIIQDYFLFMGISSISTGLIFLIRIISHYKVKFVVTEFKQGLRLIKKSFKLFISEIWNYLTNSLTLIIIGSMIGQFELGIFNIAERIKSLAIQSLQPIIHSIFPRIARKYSQDKKDANKSFLKIIFFNLTITFTVYIFANLYIYQIVGYFSQNYVLDIVPILRILLILFVLNITTEQLLAHYLVPNNLYFFINNNKIFRFILFIFLIFPLILNYGTIGAAYSILISESIGLLLVIRKFYLTKNIQ